MELYTGVIHPLVLVVSALLALTGIATLLWAPAHRALKVLVPVTYAAVAVHTVAVAALLFTGLDADLILTLGYVIASVALLALLGIGRLGTPEAASADPDPNRPVLTQVQITRVDGAAAVIVAVALAVVAWRVLVILVGAA
ncbi:hypothetical protein QQX09_11445 [Demequina sp. SYSU T00192]|uniref:Integral membrane protein n=1 Tax=Demequina litoralis TaxID=3051660 RepID=A0ABT8GBE4_9MICO|nr:hypothetical protein [Demequina sp. SYSU T00192]MDN4476468.1 hypothetical protein [Demequina sp. SYSU T00192]